MLRALYRRMVFEILGELHNSYCPGSTTFVKEGRQVESLLRRFSGEGSFHFQVIELELTYDAEM